MTVDHVDNLQFAAVKLVRCCRATVVNYDNTKTLIGKAPDSRRNALVGKNTGCNNICYFHIAQH